MVPFERYFQRWMSTGSRRTLVDVLLARCGRTIVYSVLRNCFTSGCQRCPRMMLRRTNRRSHGERPWSPRRAEGAGFPAVVQIEVKNWRQIRRIGMDINSRAWATDSTRGTDKSMSSTASSLSCWNTWRRGLRFGTVGLWLDRLLDGAAGVAVYHFDWKGGSDAKRRDRTYAPGIADNFRIGRWDAAVTRCRTAKIAGHCSASSGALAVTSWVGS